MNVTVEISGRFSTEGLQAATEDDFGVSLSSGLGGERLVRVWSLSRDTIERLIRLACEVIDRDRINGLKITIDGNSLEVGSVRGRELESLKDFVTDALKEIRSDPGPPAT